MQISKTDTSISTTTTVEMLGKIEFAKKAIADIEKAEKAKAMAQLETDPDSLPGYTITSRKTKQVDPVDAWTKLVEVMGGDTFAKFCTFSPTKKEGINAYKEAAELPNRNVKTSPC